MQEIRFEWDPAKAASNLRKHGLSFDVATRVFLDPFYVSVEDCSAAEEERWQTLGSVAGHFILMVIHTLREEHADGAIIDIVRIISARYASPKERRRYEEENG